MLRWEMQIAAHEENANRSVVITGAAGGIGSALVRRFLTRGARVCAPAGQEEFFAQVGVPVATRLTPPPKLDKEAQDAFVKKAGQLAPKYRTELIKPGPLEIIEKLFK